MPTELDAALTQRFLALSSVNDDSDWPDVRRRAGDAAVPRKRRGLHLVLAGVAIVVSALLVTPALGLGDRLVRLFAAGEHAPPRVQKDFASLDVGAPPGMAPGVKAGAARHVATFTIEGGRVALWVAPTRTGGYCYTFEEEVGGCRRDAPSGLGLSVRTGENLLFGDLPSRTGATLWLVTDAGIEREIPLVWVGEPIDAGFFAYRVPDELGGSSTAGSVLVVRDESGRAVSREPWGGPIPMPDLDR
ncbi:MAG: hypothetical protein ACRDM2_03905 [Gaiellaceae bacterium]